MTPDQLLAPSASFKKEATKSVAAILFFLFVYLLLMAVALALVVGAFYAGIGIIALHPTFYTLVAGIGIIGAGVMVFVFLVKFLFSSAGWLPGRFLYDPCQPESGGYSTTGQITHFPQ